MATSTVNSKLHSKSQSLSLLTRVGSWAKLVLVAGVFLPAVLLPATQALANAAAELDVLRVDVPLDRDSFKNGELEISSLIANNTYIDVEEFNLRAIELEASTSRNGEVRLKVGRYVTPPVPLPGSNNEGLLRIEAPHKSNAAWRLLIEGRIHITSLTAVLEPRDNNASYYESRYESRGYTLGRDVNYRAFSGARHDTWPYSWLGNNYDYNRRSAHWFWLNNSRSRFGYNPGYGHSHRHTARCYDRFGRHLRFNSGINNRSRFRDSQRALNYSRSRNSLRSDVQRRERAPTREPIMRAPNTPRATPNHSDALRNQAAQVQLQQRLQHTQARRQQQLERQQREARRNANDRRSSNRSERSRPSRSERAQRYNRSQPRRSSEGRRQYR